MSKILRLLVVGLFLVSNCFAQSSASKTTKLNEVVVSDRAESSNELSSDLPTVDSFKIYSGKKATVTDLSKLPRVNTNNYRQAFSQTPGLFTSEVSNESFVSFSYRGLGDPHESFNLNILKDGIPISADLFGYPANYYAPPVDAVEKIEFIRGGASLLYGPQIGGALNFVTKEPTKDLQIRTKHVFGSNDLYTTHNEISGTDGDTGYLAYFNHRQSDGFRSENSDYIVNNAHLKVVRQVNKDTKFKVTLDAYDADHGEPGGLAVEDSEGAVNFFDDNTTATLTNDRLKIERYQATLELEHKIDSDTKWNSKLFGGYYRRDSRRQDAGTAPNFGGLRNGDTNTVLIREFRTVGLDNRIQRDWDNNTLTFGLFLYGSDSPFRQDEGDSAGASTGTPERDSDRNSFNAAFFAENKFEFGKFSITPGFRLENVYQNIEENFNTVEGELRNESFNDLVLLPAVGITYDLNDNLEIYANASTSYQSKTFQSTVPLSSGDVINDDLDAAESQIFEIGIKGNPTSWSKFDVSIFRAEFEDQFGRVGVNLQNVGASNTEGFDVTAQVSTLKLADNLLDTNFSKSAGDLAIYFNGSFLDAEFTDGDQAGNTPQYAPDYLIRTGLVYDYHSKYKIALLGTYVDNHFGDDGNSEEREIPSYKVWDLTFEGDIISDKITLIAGINNLFDERYFSRVRGNGVEPALPRNVYTGLEYKF